MNLDSNLEKIACFHSSLFLGHFWPFLYGAKRLWFDFLLTKSRLCLKFNKQDMYVQILGIFSNHLIVKRRAQVMNSKFNDSVIYESLKEEFATITTIFKRSCLFLSLITMLLLLLVLLPYKATLSLLVEWLGQILFHDPIDTTKINTSDYFINFNNISWMNLQTWIRIVCDLNFYISSVGSCIWLQ